MSFGLQSDEHRLGLLLSLFTGFSKYTGNSWKMVRNTPLGSKMLNSCKQDEIEHHDQHDLSTKL